jgi:hypothetical protein
MDGETLVCIQHFCGERFSPIAETLEKLLAGAGVDFEIIEGERFYPQMQVDLALGGMFRVNLGMETACSNN